MSTKICIIIGASHAASQLAFSLRQEGWTGRIQLIGSEPYMPYHRPPLSKTFLAGEKSIDEIRLRPESLYQAKNIECLLGVSVVAIDRLNKKLKLNNGGEMSYDKLALCVGSRVRKISLGVGLKGVCYLRNIEDVVEIKTR